MFRKQQILQIQNVYTACGFALGKGFFVGAGSETESDVRLHDMNNGSSQSLDQCPGGMMSIVPVPGADRSLVSIMGLFPPFIGLEAGLFMHQHTGGRWESRRISELPFAHRCEFLPGEAEPVLVAATVSKHKENPADWSKSGELWAFTPDQKLVNWEGRLLDTRITRNHGMCRARFNGKEQLFVSGKEGIFSIGKAADGNWDIQRVFENEVSEMCFIDLNGDGMEELVCIEPFHGENLHIYRQSEEGWELVYADQLAFGHGLNGGLFRGKSMVVTGNRAADLSLQSYHLDDPAKFKVNKEIIEEGVGPTQTQIFCYQGKDYILSANQRKHEVALYS